MKSVGHKPANKLPVNKLPTRLQAAPSQRNVKVEQLKQQVKAIAKTIKGL